MSEQEVPSITGAELTVLEQLWERGESTIGDLRDALYPAGGASKFATVQKLLARLVTKRLVGRRKAYSNWMYRSLIARHDVIGGELRRVADRLGNRSLTPLLTYLVEAGQLSAKERAHLRSLLDVDPNPSSALKKPKR